MRRATLLLSPGLPIVPCGNKKRNACGGGSVTNLCLLSEVVKKYQNKPANRLSVSPNEARELSCPACFFCFALADFFFPSLLGVLICLFRQGPSPDRKPWAQRCPLLGAAKWEARGITQSLSLCFCTHCTVIMK